MASTSEIILTEIEKAIDYIEARWPEGPETCPVEVRRGWEDLCVARSERRWLLGFDW